MTITLRDLLNDGKVHVLDGAMGTMLYSKGFFLNVCYDELNLKQPKLVREVHVGFVHLAHELRLLEVQLVITDVQEEALGVEHRAHRAVEHVDFSVVQEIAQRGGHPLSVIRYPLSVIRYS